MDELFTVVTRIDERTAAMDARITRIERGIFFGDGGEPLMMRVARHDEQIRATREGAEHAGRSSGARWGAAAASIVSAIIAAVVAVITGRQQ